MPGGAPRHHGSDHWRAGCRETGLSRSGRGRRKRTRTTGTSSAAYFTRVGGSGKRNDGNVVTAPRADRTRSVPLVRRRPLGPHDRPLPQRPNIKITSRHPQQPDSACPRPRSAVSLVRINQLPAYAAARPQLPPTAYELESPYTRYAEQGQIIKRAVKDQYFLLEDPPLTAQPLSPGQLHDSINVGD